MDRAPFVEPEQATSLKRLGVGVLAAASVVAIHYLETHGIITPFGP